MRNDDDRDILRRPIGKHRFFQNIGIDLGDHQFVITRSMISFTQDTERFLAIGSRQNGIAFIDKVSFQHIDIDFIVIDNGMRAFTSPSISSVEPKFSECSNRAARQV
jgi:hypothetical protein